MKKLSVLILVLLMVCLVAMPVLAAQTATLTVSASKTALKPGDTFTVTVSTDGAEPTEEETVAATTEAAESATAEATTEATTASTTETTEAIPTKGDDAPAPTEIITIGATAPVVEKTGFPWWIPFALLGVGSIIAIVILKKKS